MASNAEGFVFHSDEYSRDLIPRRLNTAEVAMFIESRIDNSTRLVPLQQAEKLVDFYDLQEVVPHFERLLNRQETTATDLTRSAIEVRIVARVGTPAACEFARAYYSYLAQRAETTALLDLLISVYEALGSAADPKPLAAAISQRLQTLEPQVKAHPDLIHEVQALERMSNYTLPRTVQANQAKDRVRSIQNPAQRIEEEINIYLGLKPGFPEILPAWAARRLRREIWADHPEQQTVRADNPARRSEIVAAFRAALGRIESNQTMPQTQKDFLVGSCLRAVEFFGGALSEPEQEIVNRPGRQFYVLSNE